MSEPVKTHESCPECGHNECLTVFEDGGMYCHSCSKAVGGKGAKLLGKTKGKVRVDTENQELTIKGYRGVDQDVAEFYGILTGSVKGEDVTRVYPYPHMPKTRILPKDFSQNKGFKNNMLFGMDRFNAGSSKYLTIVEGEDDVPSAYQMLGKKYPVVGMAGGSAKQVLKNPECKEFINAFESIIIATDSDDAGNAAAETFSRTFPNRCYRVNMSKHKDPNDYLTAGDSSDFLYAWINRKKYVPENIFNTTEQFVDIIKGDTGSMYLPTGIKDFDEKCLGLFQGYWTLFQAPEGIGKQLPNTTLIPTPGGFTQLGDLVEGDTIFGKDGKETAITGITETQYDVPCYTITFSDGTQQVAGGPHRWGVYTTDNVYKVKTTDDILSEGVTRGEGVALYSVPLCEPVEYESKELSMDPYSFGLWLGDGHSYSRGISVGYDDAEQFESLVSVDRKKEERTCITYWVDTVTHSNLRDVGALKNKHIPHSYLHGSVEQRQELLMGLMDSDGSVSGVGCEFYTSNETLLKDFLVLARGLGYKCRVSTKEAKLYGKSYGDTYRVWFLAHGDRPIFKYERKQKKVKYCETFRATRKTIRSIEPTKSVPSRCLEVDNEDHLYLCGEHYTVTHNTEFMRKLEYGILSEHPTVPIAVMHLEETKKRSLLGLASYVLNKDVTLQDTKVEVNDKGEEEIVYLPSYKGVPEEEVLEAIKSFTDKENFYQFTLGVDEDPESILDQIRYFSEVCGVKYIFFEPIQDLGYSRQDESSLEQWLSSLSTKMARLCSELGVGVVTIAHENDDGQIRDCRMIGKRAGVVVKLERDKQATDEDDRNTTTLTVLKNRPVGNTGFAGQLMFDPSSFTLSEKEY